MWVDVNRRLGTKWKPFGLFDNLLTQRLRQATERHACFCFPNVISPQCDASRSCSNGRPILYVISRVAWKSPREGGQRAQHPDVDNMHAVHQSHNRRSLLCLSDDGWVGLSCWLARVRLANCYFVQEKHSTANCKPRTQVHATWSIIKTALK